MEDIDIGLRAQDFHEALKELPASGARDAKFKNTMLVGKAATLAMHFKGLPFVDNEEALFYAAGELGIGSNELSIVLNQLEQLSWASVVYRSKTEGSIKRVELSIPHFRNGYEELGQLLRQKTRTESEQAGLALLNELMACPLDEDRLNQFGLSLSDLSIMQDIMVSGQLLSKGVANGKKLIYTPLAIDSNPAQYLSWSAQHHDRIGQLMDVLANNQGMPLVSEEIKDFGEMVNEATLSGILMPVKISGANGSHRFLFAPKGGLKPEQKVILDKARAIVSCVRYGQHFAPAYRIHSPWAVLQKLKSQKKFDRGRPDIQEQYGLLVEKAMGYVFPDGIGHNFKLYDTPENMLALDLAIEMVDTGDQTTLSINQDAQKALSSFHGYKGPTSERPHLVRECRVSPESRADLLTKLSKMFQGAEDV